MISSGTETVYVKNQGDEEAIGENTASFTITASFDADSITNNEVKPVDPIWECTYEGATFVPTEGVEPPPQNPGDPTVDDLIASTASSPNSNSWTTKVSSENVGQWLLKFKVTVTYSKQDQNTGQTIPGETFGPYSDENTFAFIATTKDWKVELASTDVVCRHSTKPAKRPTLKVTATLKDSDIDRKVKISASTTGGQIKFGETENDATRDDLDLTIPVNDEKTFYISGEKESIKTNDVVITAYTNDSPGEIKGSRSVTVLWVKVELRTAGEISIDNSRRNFFALISIEDKDKYKLGQRIGKDLTNADIQYGYVFEIKGQVYPNDFTSNVTLVRDCEQYIKCDWNISFSKAKKTPLNIKDTVALIKQADIDQTKQFSCPKGEFAFTNAEGGGAQILNDTSFDALLDKKPPFIYDLDMPSVPILTTDPQLFHIRLVNFREFALFGNYRCSDVLEFSFKSFFYKIKGQKVENIKSWGCEVKEEVRVIPPN